MKKTVSRRRKLKKKAILMVADHDGYSLIILGESYMQTNITYGSVKWNDQGNILKSQLFLGVKNM